MILELAVLKAVRDALVPALDPIPVFDEPPQDQVLPLVAIGGVEATAAGTHDAPAWDFVVRLVVVTAYEGKTEVLEALARIREALDRVSLALASGQAVSCRVEHLSTARIVEEGVVSTQGVAVVAIMAADETE